MDEKQYDIVALGESLVDFLVKESPDGKQLLLEGNPGGAPANVLAAAARQGMRTAFLGKLGRDVFGNFLLKAISGAGVDVGGVVFGEEPTTLAMVALDDTGNRSFRFYRNQTADVEFFEAELDRTLLTGTRIFHFGSVSMTAQPSRNTTAAAAELARKSGAKIAFDPNLRPNLWSSLDDAKESICRGMEMADFVKVAEEELVFLTGETDPIKGGEQLIKQYGMELLAVTMGDAGCVCFAGGHQTAAGGFRVDCVDTTGAGDAFWGAALSFMLRQGNWPADYSRTQLEELAVTANAAGALATCGYGAIPAMPTPDEISALISVRATV